MAYTLIKGEWLDKGFLEINWQLEIGNIWGLVYIDSYAWDCVSSGLPRVGDGLSIMWSQCQLFILLAPTSELDEQGVGMRWMGGGDPHSRNYPVSPTYPGEALKKHLFYNMGNMAHVIITQHDTCLSSSYHVNMQWAFAQCWIHTNKIENQKQYGVIIGWSVKSLCKGCVTCLY